MILRFSGKREDLHTQLKQWCEEADRSMTGTIMELIKAHLKKSYANKKVSVADNK